MSRTYGQEPLWLWKQRAGVEEHNCYGDMEICELNPDGPFAPGGSMPRCDSWRCKAEPLKRLTVKCWHRQATLPGEEKARRRVGKEQEELRIEPVRGPGTMSHRYIWDRDTGERVPDVAGELPGIERLPSCNDRGRLATSDWLLKNGIPASYVKEVDEVIRLWTILPCENEAFHLEQDSPGAPAFYWHEYTVNIHDATRCQDCAFSHYRNYGYRGHCREWLSEEQSLYYPGEPRNGWSRYYHPGRDDPHFLQRRRIHRQLDEYRYLWNGGAGEDDLPQL